MWDIFGIMWDKISFLWVIGGIVLLENVVGCPFVADFQDQVFVNQVSQVTPDRLGLTSGHSS